MAYVKRSRSYPTRAASNVISITLPKSVQNDVVYFQIELDVGTISSLSGNNFGAWTQRYAQTNGGYMYVYECIVGATPDTSLTINTTDATTIAAATATVVTEANTTTPIHQSASAQNASAISHDAPTLTTSNNNCLILIFTGSGTGTIYRPREGVYTEALAEYTFKNAVSVSSTFQQTAGAIGTTHFYLGASSNTQAQFYVIAIDDAGNGIFDGYIDKSTRPFNYLHLMLGSGQSGELSDATIYDPTSVSYENISSLTNGSYTTTGAILCPNIVGLESATEYSVESIAMYDGSAANGDMLLSGYSITETYGSTDNYDLSAEKIIVNAKFQGFDFKPSSEIGACFGISDKTNARFWQLGSIDTVPSMVSGIFPTIIDANSTTYQMDSVGTFNANNVGALIWGCEPVDEFQYLIPAAVSIMKYMVLVGGCSSRPTSFNTAYRVAQSAVLNTVLAQGGITSGQFFVCHDIQIGGSDALYWDCSNQSAEWPSAYDAANGKLNFKIDSASIELLIKASSGDTVNMSTGIFNFGNYHKFTIDSATHNSDIYTFTGRTILNATVTLRALSNLDYGGLTFDSCKQITLNGADISGSATKGRVTISNGVDTNSIEPLNGATQAALQLLVDDLANVTFSGNTTAIRIEYTGTGDITLNFDAITWTSNTVDIHYNSTNASALTANMQNGSNASTSAISGSATGVTIANDITATINVNVTGAEITILTAGTQTELYHVETGSTTQGYTYTYSSDFNGDVQVFKQGYKPYWLASNVFSNSNQTITVNLEEDPASQF